VQPKNDVHIIPFVEVLDCVLAGEKAIYLSTPVTNGPRALEWKVRNSILTEGSQEYKELYKKSIIVPNCEDAKSVAIRLRKKHGCFVIDPSCFFVEGWSQRDYLELWCGVVERHASIVVLNDGWEYSNGCVTEYIAAVSRGIKTMNIHGESIPLEAALTLISVSINTYSEMGMQNDDIGKGYRDLVRIKESMNV